MAISSDQPISAENLKAVVEKLMGGVYLPETLVANCFMYDYKSSYVMFFADLSRYSKLEVTVGINSAVYQGMVDPTLGDHRLEKINGSSYPPAFLTITFRADSTCDYIQMIEDYSEKIESVRIIGYR